MSQPSDTPNSPNITSVAITQGIRVEARAQYSPERSQPQAGMYFFVYTITIENLGTETAQLMSRHWIITDGNQHVEEVRGPGVVGETPVLRPEQPSDLHQLGRSSLTAQASLTRQASPTAQASQPGRPGSAGLVGNSFSYSSGCMLRTQFGTMRGTYQMVRPNGTRFEAEIAPFVLALPHAIN